MGQAPLDLVGKKFNKLIILSFAGIYISKRGRTRTTWKCRCDCGNEVTVIGSDLIRGGTQSCGCLRGYRHGHSPRNGKESPTYVSWCAMKSRCSNPGMDHWDRYGGRGIKVCDRWMKFENFLDDMGDRPPGKTIDRIDNEGNYEPGNCKWSTQSEQVRNGRWRKEN